MNALLVKEGMAGKVQMIHIDSPYGIKYASNFQPRIECRDVKDKDEDLTRGPEQIKAYRNTWKLGLHSYLTYLRDRLLLARELLTESGSIFVQINDENLRLVRCLPNELFGSENFVALVAFAKTTGFGGELLDTITDDLLCYAKDKNSIKSGQPFTSRVLGHEGAENYDFIALPDGTRRRLSHAEKRDPASLPNEANVFASARITSRGQTAEGSMPITHHGRVFDGPGGLHWKITVDGMLGLSCAENSCSR